MHSPRLQSGAHIGRIRIEDVLGVGGMGEVYRGFDESLRRWVAVKSIRAEHGFTVGTKARFVREARLLSQLDHPGICRVYDLIEGEHADYLVLELVEGRTLREVMREEMNRSAALRVAEEVADALAAAHRQGIVHRDLKPENIMLTSSGVVKVLDFGIARSIAPGEAEDLPSRPSQPADDPMSSLIDGGAVTEGWEVTSSPTPGSRTGVGSTSSSHAGFLVGTVPYMSPEQAGGGPVGAAGDMYSLGVVLHEMLTGRMPYGDAEGPELYIRVIRAEVAPATELPGELAGLVRELLHLDPRGRPSAEEVRRRICHVRERPQRLRRRAAVITAGGAAVMAVAVGVGTAFSSRLQVRRQIALAQRFTMELQDAEFLLWREQSLPLHDVRPARRSMHERLDGIAEATERGGQLATGPGHAAMGRGLLALGEHQNALRHLEKAWDAGYRTPETAYALGLALGALYEKALLESASVADEARRRERRREAETTLRDPALAYLRGASGAAGVVPEYVEALLALYEERLEDAVDRAREAFARAGWLYQAKILEGRALTLQAVQDWWGGDWEEAMGVAGAAEEAFSQAIRIGESDPLAYQGLCALWTYAHKHGVWNLGLSEEELFQRGERACRDGLVADADRVELLVLLAELDGDRAEHMIARGLDALPVLLSSLNLLERAFALSPEGARIAEQISERSWQRGKMELNSAQDPRASFEVGLEWARRALERQPRSKTGLNLQGAILLDLGLYEYWVGHDPRESLRGAAEAFQAFGAVFPDEPAASVNEGMAVYILGRYQVRRLGANPGAAKDHPIRALEGVIELNPRMSWAHRTLGSILATMAEYEALAGRDPMPLIVRAAAHLDRAGGLRENDVNTWSFLADAHLVAAGWAAAQDLDPEAHLESAGEAISRGDRVAAGNTQMLKARGKAELVRARRHAARNRDAAPALSAAEGWFSRVVASDPNDQEARAALLEVALENLERVASHGASRTPSVTAVRELLSQAERLQPDLWWLPLVRGRLVVIEAGGAGVPEQARWERLAAALDEMKSACCERPGFPLCRTLVAVRPSLPAVHDN